MEGFELELAPGKYVVAVSGGLDSVALLDMVARLCQKDPANYSAVVAHFDHGIRADSADDRKFVAELARSYGLDFEYDEGQLGAKASENAARQARYQFLKRIKAKYQADAVITAHHQDDLIETIMINLLRGTNRRGLYALRSRPGLVRPLLGVSRAELTDYAQARGLTWREDSTNQDEAILRNYLRQNYVKSLDLVSRSEMLRYAEQASLLGQEIDLLIDQLLPKIIKNHTLKVDKFIMLPHAVSKEILIAWLGKTAPSLQISKKLIERLVAFIKTGKNGTFYELGSGYKLKKSKSLIKLQC